MLQKKLVHDKKHETERFLEEVIENHRTVAEAYRKMLVSLEAKSKKKNK